MNKEVLLKFISKQGYKRNSPDVDNPINVIPDNRISMKDVDFPVHGVDNLGNEKIMHPGEEHKFLGDYVVETPLKKFQQGAYYYDPKTKEIIENPYPEPTEVALDWEGYVHNRDSIDVKRQAALLKAIIDQENAKYDWDDPNKVGKFTLHGVLNDPSLENLDDEFESFKELSDYNKLASIVEHLGGASSKPIAYHHYDNPQKEDELPYFTNPFSTKEYGIKDILEYKLPVYADPTRVLSPPVEPDDIGEPEPKPKFTPKPKPVQKVEAKKEPRMAVPVMEFEERPSPKNAILFEPDTAKGHGGYYYYTPGGERKIIGKAQFDSYRARGVDDITQYQEGGEVEISQHGWDYRREGDKYLTKRSEDDKWIEATGIALKAIKADVYKDPETLAGAGVNQQEQDAKPKGSYVTRLQDDLLRQGYWLGKKGSDGIMGNFTRSAQKAMEQGIPAAEYNKQFEQHELKTMPGVAIPASVVNNAKGVRPPTAARMSADAEESLEKLEESTPDVEKVDKPSPEIDPEVGSGALAYSDRPYTYTPVLDITDEAYQHADDFIIDTPYKWNKVQRHATKINAEPSVDEQCLAGALNCNAQMVSDKVGANSVRGLIQQAEKAGKWKRADLSKYSVPSKGKLEDEVDAVHNKSYDSWEIANALVGEGLGQDLYVANEKDIKQEMTIPSRLEKDFIKTKRIPLGAMIFQSDARDRGYTRRQDGLRPAHSMTVVGYDDKGEPLVYDSGTLRKLTEIRWLGVVNRIVIPNGYENYTYDNLVEGRNARFRELGYMDEDTQIIKDKPNYSRDYVNHVQEGITHKAHIIGNDYGIPKRVMDKLSKRVIGLAAQESNFGDAGEEELSLPRQTKIYTEGYLQNLGKMTSKAVINLVSDTQELANNIYNLFSDEIEQEDVGLSSFYDRPDWQLEMDAHKQAQGDPEKAKMYFNQWKMTRGERDIYYDDYTSSVGPLSIKYFPEYVKKKFNIDKSSLYGLTVTNKGELSNSGVAALVHLVENYKMYEKKHKDLELTEDELVDLVTVAYNNKSKAQSQEFVNFYIKNKTLSDDYLSKVKAFETKYSDGQSQPQVAETPSELPTPPLQAEPDSVPSNLGFIQPVPFFQTGGETDGVLKSIYSKYPGMKRMGPVTLKADPEFTREKTGVGDIEYFAPDPKGRGTVIYDNEFEYAHPDPKKMTHGIVYNPATNDPQNVFLDMLHGMSSVPEYADLREQFKDAIFTQHSEDFERDWQYKLKEAGEGDGRAQFMENWIDGKIRNLFFEGTPEDFQRSRYWELAKPTYLSDFDTHAAYTNLENFLTTGETPIKPMKKIKPKLDPKFKKGGTVYAMNEAVDNIKNLISLTTKSY